MSQTRHPLLGIGSLLVLLAPLPAVAAAARQQDKEDRTSGSEILVTAERRAEPIDRTPIAISAYDQDFIGRRKIDSVKDLITYTPGFAGNSQDSWLDTIAIRGIVSTDYGIGGDPSISIFKDGIYQGRTGSAVTSLFDVERAEALRGPQGLLFGRNAISGAISVTTRQPSLDGVGGHVFLGIGQTERIEGETALNVPIGDHWAVRLAGYHVSNRGWIDNVYTPGIDDRLMAQNKSAGRGAVLFQSGPLSVVLSGEYERRRLDGTPYRASNDDRQVFDAIDAALGTTLVIGGTRRDVDTDLVAPQDSGRIWGTTLRADLDLGSATLTSLSGYRHHQFFYSEDYDGTPLLLGDYFQRQHGSYASEEVRLVSASDQRLTWSAGVSGYREKVFARYDNLADENFVCTAGYGYDSCEQLTQALYGSDYVPAKDTVLDDANKAKSINTGLALYADASYTIVPRLELGLGARYTLDRKRFQIDILPSGSSLGNIWTYTYYTEGYLKSAKTWQGVTPRLYVRYDLAAELSGYASVTRGYKAGGFGSFTLSSDAPLDTYGTVPAGTRPDDFAPETVWSKELGLKGNLLSHRLQFDVTGFHYVYRDLQTVDFNPATRTQQVINVGRAYGYGVEATATFRPSRYFDIYGNLAYAHTRLVGDRDCTSRDCGGLPNPRWNSSGAATAHYPLPSGEAYLTGEWSYVDRARRNFAWRGITVRPAYSVVNLRLGFRSERGWDVTAYVQNLFNATYYGGAENNGQLTPANVWGVSQPRNLGLNLRWYFGKG